MELTWLRVDEVTDVVDEQGMAIGRLSPGKRYRALEVGATDVVVGGAGTRGTVPRSAVALLDEPPATSLASHTTPPVATPPVATSPVETPRVEKPPGTSVPRWLMPAALGFVIGAAAALLFSSLTSDSDGDASGTVRDVTPELSTAAPQTAVATTATTTLAPETTVAATAPETTTAPTVAPETTVATVATTAPVATTTPPAPVEVTTIVEVRPPGPHIPPAPETALFFAGPNGGVNFSANICPSGNTSLFLDSVDRNGLPVRGSGYGVVDPAGFGTVSMWYLDETGSLVGITEPGEPFAIAVTADAMAIRGDRFDLDLLYTWTWTSSTSCAAIDDLVTQLGL